MEITEKVWNTLLNDSRQETVQQIEPNNRLLIEIDINYLCTYKLNVFILSLKNNIEAQERY